MPSVSAPISESGELLPTSNKGRLRKPSAKALAAAEAVIPAISGIVKVPTPPAAAAAVTTETPHHHRRPILSLQYAVAETVVNDEELPFEDGVDARPDGITIESIGLADWRTRGFITRRKKSWVPPAPIELPAAAAETSGSSSDHGSSPKHEEPMDSSPTHSSEDSKVVSGHHQPAEVKRKRGRPFKGQEKPIEERLMIETSKIRRLIDDVIRKGDNSTAGAEFFLRLRNIASDLDSVMALMPPSTGGPSKEEDHEDNNFLQPEEE